MTWGGSGYVDLPAATTWDGITGREWESAGAGMEAWSGGVGFHLYYDLYSWSTPAWTEFTDAVDLEAFSIRRGVRSWWEGTSAGSAVIVIANDAEKADFAYTVPNTKVKLTVDVPSGEQDLFVGFVRERVENYDPESATMRLVLQDHMGYTGQAKVPARSWGASQNGTMMREILRDYGNEVELTDIVGVPNATGLVATGTVGASNLIDQINEYVRGELGMLWVDRHGHFQALFRDWWYPQPDPVATIGSLDRAAGGTRADPAEDTGYKIPLNATEWRLALDVNTVTWNYNGGTTTGSGATQSGVRARTFTVHVGGTDAANNLGFIVQVVGADTSLKASAARVRFPADISADSMDYAATAEVSDFIEVAKETTLGWAFKRTWDKAWVTGVEHDWSAATGWTCTLVADAELGGNNIAVST